MSNEGQNYLLKQFSKIVSLRQAIHRRPCLSANEEYTKNQLLEFFKEYSPDEIITDIGGCGFAVVYNGAQPGPTTMFTSELDAIPVSEKNEIPYASKIKGVGHLCGHDGHMASMAALGTLLSHQRPEKGRVVLLYRPQEENGRGAPLVVNDPKFKSIEPDVVFGFHNLPGYPLGSVVIRKGQFCWTASDVCIKLTGRASHGGEPEAAINPTLALVKIVSKLEDFQNWEGVDPERNGVLTGYAQIGENPLHTTAPGHGEIRGCIRSQTAQEMQFLFETIQGIVQEAAAPHGLKWEVYLENTLPVTFSDDKALETLEQAAWANKIPVVWMETANRWSDDFGVLSARWPGGFFGIGTGENSPQLHAPDFDFPDDNLLVACKVYWDIVTKLNI